MLQGDPKVKSYILLPGWGWPKFKHWLWLWVSRPTVQVQTSYLTSAWEKVSPLSKCPEICKLPPSSPTALTHLPPKEWVFKSAVYHFCNIWSALYITPWVGFVQGFPTQLHFHIRCKIRVELERRQICLTTLTLWSIHYFSFHSTWSFTSSSTSSFELCHFSH